MRVVPIVAGIAAPTGTIQTICNAIVEKNRKLCLIQAGVWLTCFFDHKQIVEIVQNKRKKKEEGKIKDKYIFPIFLHL